MARAQSGHRSLAVGGATVPIRFRRTGAATSSLRRTRAGLVESFGGKLGSIDGGAPDFELTEPLALPRVYGRPPECAKTGPNSYGYYAGVEAREVLAGWFRREIRPQLSPETLVNPTRVGGMRALLAVPEAERVAWIHEVVAAKNDCVTPMPELP
ncbi:hypothetical protein FHX42_000695 [Saccharopolyspora lacisalsi]|uniref:Uncharacterized protein n=1 Tax=Halosaccharopolyspora lacisalsi TaxID=1000566 RepID=A0A839DSX0_9PSEU|nr:hypothetical protein [Halosaccharopolyspora lacisalsi]MBA8823366.1 hypothetical protein [Halosaccharopolyspora lacisalsi]